MKRRHVAVLAAIALVVVLIPTALFAEKVPVDVYEVGCAVDPGTEWLSDNGNRLHIYGQIGKTVLYDVETFEVVGEDLVVVNAIMKLATGEMRFCGTFSLRLLEYSTSHTLDGTWNAKLGAAGFSGRALGIGAFSRRGDRTKLSLESVAPEAVPAELLAILGQSPWTECDQITGVSRVTGFIRHKPVE